MITYFFKQFLSFIASIVILFAVVFLIIALSTNKTLESSEGELVAQDFKKREEFALSNHLQLPLFYWSLKPLSHIPYQKSISPLHLGWIEDLSMTFGEKKHVQTYYHNLIALAQSNRYNFLKAYLLKAKREQLELLNKELSLYNDPDLATLKSSLNNLLSSSAKWKTFVPYIYWNGKQNRFHVFIQDSFYFNASNTSFWNVLWKKIKWTIIISFPSVLIIYMIGVPLGILAAQHSDRKWVSVLTFMMYLFYVIPPFLSALLLIVLLSNPDMLYLFPSTLAIINLEELHGISEKISVISPYIILPVASIFISSVGYVYEQMKTSMHKCLKKNNIRNMTVLGVPKSKIVYKYALRDALTPVLAQIANLLPFIIAGSIIIEIIFSVPGVGKFLYQSYMNGESSVLFKICFFLALLSLTGSILTDILVAMIDRRILSAKS